MILETKRLLIVELWCDCPSVLRFRRQLLQLRDEWEKMENDSSLILRDGRFHLMLLDYALIYLNPNANKTSYWIYYYDPVYDFR